MSDKKPWYKSKELRKLQREWYRKLADEGFYDVEGGVEGPLLKGPTSTVSLHSLANKPKIDGGLKGDRAPREFDDVASDELDAINYLGGGKARYYHHAELIAVQAIRECRLSDERCWVWLLHSQSEGERTIAEALDISRSKIRKHIAALRENISIRLDNEYL
ncbi:MAG: hypothetical protein AMS22_13105 [Thiotrichales bacterium SG8_50]|nr:MAG: hypothetical protein AMS22_13105 [Thiotrichales bacterium SG8_50]